MAVAEKRAGEAFRLVLIDVIDIGIRRRADYSAVNNSARLPLGTPVSPPRSPATVPSGSRAFRLDEEPPSTSTHYRRTLARRKQGHVTDGRALRAPSQVRRPLRALSLAPSRRAAQPPHHRPERPVRDV